MLSKKELRKIMLKKLKKQKEEEAQTRSLKIKEKLFRLKVFKKARTVMFYLARDCEVQTRFMINEAVKLGKKIVVPTCDIKAKTILPCFLTGLGSKHFKKGPYGIEEPSCKKNADPKHIDLVVVPGVAFDKKGNRLGRGRGYYDRFLGMIPEDTPTIGLAFKFQVLKCLTNCLPHDIRVDKVLFA